MSFQFSPETLLLDINRKIVVAESEVKIAQRDVNTIEAQTGQRGTVFRRSLSLRRAILSKKTSIVNDLKNQIQMLQDEISIRGEIFQPTDINLDTGETSTIIENIDTGGITAIIEDIGKKDGIDLKTLGIIGAAILILT